MLATLLAVVPTGSPDVPVLSTLQAEPAGAHTYLEETNVFVTRCDDDGVCRYVEVLRPKRHLHIWENVCKVVATVAGGVAARATRSALRILGTGTSAVAVVYERVCQTVEKIIWAL